MSVPAKVPTLFLGATGMFFSTNIPVMHSRRIIGYVGGTFLSRLLVTPTLLDKLDLTLYVRSPEKAQRLTSEFGLKTVIGTLADLDKIEQLSEQAHLVISIVSAIVSNMRSRTNHS